MRPLSAIASTLVAGAACVTALANLPGPTPGAEPLSHRATRLDLDPAGWAPPPPAVPAARADRAPLPPESATFANTYYDFPDDDGGVADTTVYTTRCEPIAQVSRSFHDRLCVQGSGRLASGATVSFAGRGCACAETCPRTGQRICYERLDPARFPHGRGTTGRPITPLRTVAVDPTVIPMGTSLFIPEYVGLPGPDGAPHDGCFVAEDRGLWIAGRRVDVFAGDAGTRRAWEAAVPSNRGVHVFSGAGRCAGGALDRRSTARSASRAPGSLARPTRD
jgi:3D (Asp-Asp-Asp) domain-containing protein